MAKDETRSGDPDSSEAVGRRIFSRRLAAKRTQERWILGMVLESAPDGPLQIEFADGSRQTVNKGLPTSTVWVQPGILHHDVAADPEGQQRLLNEDPTAFAIRILREGQHPFTKKEILTKLEDLILTPRDGWWDAAVKGMKAHDHVNTSGGKYQWSDDVVPANKPQPRAAKRSPSSSRRFGEVTVREVEPASANDPAVKEPAPDHRGPSHRRLTRPSTDDPNNGKSFEDPRIGDVLGFVDAFGSHRVPNAATINRFRTDVTTWEDGGVKRLGYSLIELATQGTENVRTDDLRSMSVMGRGSIARLARRRRLPGLFLKVLLACDLADAARLISGSSLPVHFLLSALANHPLEASGSENSEQRVMGLLIREYLDQASGPRVAPAEIILMVRRIQQLSQSVPLSNDLAQSAHLLLMTALAESSDEGSEISSLSRAELLEVNDGRILAVGTSRVGSPVAQWIQALDRWDRPDLLMSSSVWGAVDLPTLVHHPGLAAIAERRDCVRLLKPQLDEAIASGRTPELMCLLALPDSLLRFIPTPELALGLRRQAESTTQSGVALRLFLERALEEAAHAMASDAGARAEELAAQVDRLTDDLGRLRRLHSDSIDELSQIKRSARTHQRDDRRQERAVGLKLAAAMLEEVRVAAESARDDGQARRQYEVLKGLAEADGLMVEDRPGERTAYKPSEHRILGESRAVEAGESVLVVRPTYVLSDAGDRTVVQPGDVRLA